MNRPNDDAAVDAMLAALRAGGVSCGEDAAYDWVDDLASTIRDALLAAGWTEPNGRRRGIAICDTCSSPVALVLDEHANPDDIGGPPCQATGSEEWTEQAASS